MKVTNVCVGVLLLLAVAALANAEWKQNKPYYSFSGSWWKTNYARAPFIAGNGTCGQEGFTSGYETLNVTFDSDGTYRFSSLVTLYKVFAYRWNYFDPEDPCWAYPEEVVDDSYTSAYNWEGYHYFYKGSYTIVIYSEYSQSAFAGQITKGYQFSTANATTNSTNNNGTAGSWYPVYNDPRGYCQVDHAYRSYYKQVQIKVNTTDRYDIVTYFNHSATNYPYYTYVALYKGSPNKSVETNGCGSVGYGVSLVNATYNYYYLAELVDVYLQQGQTYTVFVSGYNQNNFSGSFGLEVGYTRRARFNTTKPGFIEPPRQEGYYGYPGSYCKPNAYGYNNRPFVYAHFSVPANTNFSVYASEPNDYIFFLYSGNNSAPVACIPGGRYLDYSDSGSRSYGPYFENNFTIIATAYYLSEDRNINSNWYSDIYIVAGPSVSHYVPPTPSSSSTGGNWTTTTGHYTTGGNSSSTTGGNWTTTGHHVTTGGNSSSTTGGNWTTTGHHATTGGNSSSTTGGNWTTTGRHVTTGNHTTSTTSHHVTTGNHTTSTSGGDWTTTSYWTTTGNSTTGRNHTNSSGGGYLPGEGYAIRGTFFVLAIVVTLVVLKIVFGKN